MKFRKYLLIILVIALAVAELLYRLGVTSYGAYNFINTFYRFFNTVSNIR